MVHVCCSTQYRGNTAGTLFILHAILVGCETPDGAGAAPGETYQPDSCNTWYVYICLLYSVVIIIVALVVRMELLRVPWLFVVSCNFIFY